MKNIKNQGVTLVELMIAIGLLSVFALMLVSVLSQSISAWRVTEEKREILEVSRNVMDIITEDLESMFIDNNTDKNGLLVDYDSSGKQRLRFIRKISEENKHPILRYAASDSQRKDKQEYYNLKADKNKNLLAPGGLAEIIYCFVPQKNGTWGLYRGIQAPVGGIQSFFDDKNINTSEKIRKNCHLLAEKILHMEAKIWSRKTVTWDTKKPNGAGLIWDSTKKRLRNFSLFETKNQNITAKPTKINISLIVKNGKPKELMTDLLAIDNTAYLNNTIGMKNNLRYMLVGGEWIFYDDVSDYEVLNLRRGFWNTKVKDHLQMTTIIKTYYEKWDTKKNIPKTFETQVITKAFIGIPFIKTINLPFH